MASKDDALTLTRPELDARLDELKEDISLPVVAQGSAVDRWCDIAERLEVILASCSAEDLPWFHARADALMDDLTDLTSKNSLPRTGREYVTD